MKTELAGNGVAKDPRKWKKFGVPTTIGITALLLGSGLGGVGSQERIQELTASEQQLTAQLEVLTAKNLALVAASDKFDEERTELSQRLEEQTVQISDLDAKNAELEVQKTTLQKDKSALEAAKTELEAKIAELDALPTYTPQTFTAPVQEPVSSAYYKNCTEARSAGAAPLYSGSPGYGRHLDRDGDGVACE